MNMPVRPSSSNAIDFARGITDADFLARSEAQKHSRKSSVSGMENVKASTMDKARVSQEVEGRIDDGGIE